jgi:hypothetical protein
MLEQNSNIVLKSSRGRKWIVQNAKAKRVNSGKTEMDYSVIVARNVKRLF